MRARQIALALTAAVALPLAASNALAQGGRQTGGGMFGSGGSSFAGGGLGSSGLGGVGQSAIGGLGSSGSSFGQTLSGPPGGQGLGGGGLGGGGLGGQGFGGGGGQGLGFGGGGGATSTGFIGRSGGDVQSFFQALNPMANQGFGTQVQRAAMNRGDEANQMENVPPPIQVRVSVGFEVPPAAGRATRSDATARRLNAILDRKGMSGTRVAISEGVAMVTAAPESISERLVLERLMRLEPGVQQVQFREELGLGPVEPSPPRSDR